jgi:uncharacterized protein (TIGR03435 family)
MAMSRRPVRVAEYALCWLVTAAASFGQAPAAVSPVPAALPEWDVVSVHAADPASCTGDAGMSTNKDGISIFCVPLLFAIEQAYQIPEAARILDVPNWVKNVRYQIDAKVAGEDVAAFSKLGREAHGRMLQPLLADRFHLKAHIEQREMPVYELVVAKGGSKLKEAAPDEAGKGGHLTTNAHGKIDAANASLAALPGLLNNEVGRPVVDKTGLTGRYTFTLNYVPMSQAATDESGGPSIFTALEEQLGLKLVTGKASMEVLVIDSIDQPAAN